MPTDSSSWRGRLDALTSIRFFFAAMVLVGHFTGYFQAELGALPGFVYNMAPLGVSWFFVLSGFIIAYNYPQLSNNTQRRNFLLLRLARLWPVHCAVLTAGVIVFGVYKPGLFFHYTLTQTWTFSADLANGYNGPSWSVSNELFFYIAYVGMLAPQRWLRVLVVLVPIAIGFTLPIMHGCFIPLGAVGSNAGTPQCNYLIFQFPPARLIEFVSGVALCHFRVRIPQVVGLAAAVAVFFSLIPPVPWFGDHPLTLAVFREVLLIGGVAALISSLAREGWLSRLLSFRLLVIGGEISYAMYMTHYGINFLILPRVQAWSLPLKFVLVTTVTLLSSTLLFYFLEAPVRNLVKARLKPRTPQVPGTTTAQTSRAFGFNVRLARSLRNSCHSLYARALNR